MSRSYTLNSEAAKQADTMGNRITETGKYVGILVCAEAIIASSGAEGVEFSFKNEDNRTADFLTLWTHNKDGKELWSFKTLNALMTCVEAKTLTPTPGHVEKRVDGQKQTVAATIFPELMGKRIGLLLQKAPYTKDDGTVKYKMEIFAPFEASTGRTAKEKLEKSLKAETLQKLMLQLQDRPMQAPRKAAAAPTHAPAGQHDSFDDQDIPF